MPPPRVVTASVVAAIFLATASPTPSPAQTAATAQLTLQGQVKHPHTFTTAELQQLPAVTVDVSYASEHGPEHGKFTGPLLWTLLNNAGLVDEPGRKTHLRHVISAHGRDGYLVAVALGEVEPNAEGKQTLVAYAQDGKPTAGLRLVVPGDRRPARNVKDLIAIEVR